MLKKGSKGQEVTVWQTFLQSRKIDVKADGFFGKSTEDATKLWQARAGIEADGKVGPATLATAYNYGYAKIIGEKPEKPVSDSTIDIYPASMTWVEKTNAARLARISPVVAGRVNQFVKAASKDGVTLLVVQGLRTFAEQDALYAIGRTRPGKKVTNAKGGQSLHNYGLAVDVAPYINQNVDWADKGFKAFDQWDDIAGLEWGGNWKSFKDLPHLQDTEGMNLSRVQQLYREGGLAAVWAEVH